MNKATKNKIFLLESLEDLIILLGLVWMAIGFAYEDVWSHSENIAYAIVGTVFFISYIINRVYLWIIKHE